ncbi:MarP family serine protease [Capillimicrobium parvum]|uniref:Serine protease n=1 Tax=Capillimicrobium parvum TaxID=2884022 RepID=A0A9E7C2K2_9ACTN|nr:MarP family serine protease [Capillimicrobium parvum]UGS37844.1 Serine protease [Capillimicrobium parvum]
MTRLDWIIVVIAILGAIAGYGRGFVVGALSLAGFALGAVVGTRIAPLLMSGGSSSPYAPLFGLVGALALGVLFAAGFSGIAYRVRGGAQRIPGFTTVDGALGALLTAAIALALAWIAGAVALQTPGQSKLRREVQRSSVLRTLNSVLPPSGPILNALARIDPLPALRGPEANVPPPRAAIARVPEVRGAAGSVVRILGTACGLGVEGSGWVVADGLVVTNAHVVAGQDDTTVQVRGTGAHLDARAVAFDTDDDVAILRVPGLAAPRLRLRSSVPAGTGGALLGFPQNGPYDVRPVRVGETRETLADDAYGRGPVRRSIVPLRGRVRHGNSGGPLVDAKGRVIGTVFASTVGADRPGGYAIPNQVVRDVLRNAGATVSTGPCTR